MEGSVQRSGKRLRVNVQLIDAETGSHLWAERFEKPLGDLFDMQDEIVARLANALNTQLIVAEARRPERAPNPDSMDLYFQGAAWLNKGWSPECLTHARDFFERASALDPHNLDALNGLATVQIVIVSTYMTEDRVSRLIDAGESLANVLAVAPDNAFVYVVLGMLHTITDRADLAVADFERALSLNSNWALGHSGLGLAKMIVGSVNETEAHIRQAIRLSPLDTYAFVWTCIVGTAKVFWVPMRKRSPGTGTPSKLIEITRLPTPISLLHWHILVRLTTLRPRRSLHLSLIAISQ